MPPPSTTKKSPPGDDPPKAPRSLPEFIEEVRASAEFAAGVRAALAAMPAGPDPEILFQTAQTVFEADVARNRDIKNHIALRRVRHQERLLWQRDRNLEWRRRHFEFNAVKAVMERLAEIKKIDADRTLPDREKIDAVRQCLFGEPPKEDTSLPPPVVPYEACL